MSVDVRAATVADRAAAARLLRATLEERGERVTDEAIERTVALALAQGSAAWLAIAMIDGMVCGVALANPVVSAIEGGAALDLEELYVTPARRRSGVGRAMVQFLVEQARNSGIAAVRVHPSMAAPGFLAKVGFDRITLRRTT